MATENGYVKTFRQIESWEWYTDANTFRVFMHCLLNANFRESKYRGTVIQVGSFATTYQLIGDKLHITPSQSRLAIKRLNRTGEIAVKNTNKFLVVSVTNWAKYQGDDPEENRQESRQENRRATDNIQTTDRQTTTSEELKKERIQEVKKSTKEDLSPTDTPFYRPTLQDVKNYCEERRSTVNPEKFWSFYDGKGWMVGKNPMKKWKSAIVTWETKDKEEGKKPSIINGRPDAQIDWLDGYMEDIRRTS